MGLFNRVFNRNKEIVIFDDSDLYEDEAKKTAVKRLAIESVVGRIAKTFIQSEIRVKEDGKFIVNDTYYKFNVKPNKNQSASVFWEKAIFKLITEGEVLIVKSYDEDLLIADSFYKEELTVKEDVFKQVMVKGLELDGFFMRSDVIFIEYGNEKMERLTDSLFYDYGKLIGRLVSAQLRKNQIRGSVKIEASFSKTDKGMEDVQEFLNKTTSSVKDRDVAIFPLQKGMDYQEHSGKSSTSSNKADEITELSNEFTNQVATALGMPLPFLRGDIAELDGVTKNYMKFCIDPIIKLVNTELNGRFVDRADYIKGDRIIVKRMSYRDMFDVAVAIDKLRASSVFDGHELRDEAGAEQSDNPIHDKFLITKNYEDAEHMGQDEEENTEQAEDILKGGVKR